MKLLPLLHDMRPLLATSAMRRFSRSHGRVGRVEYRVLMPRNALIHHLLYPITVGKTLLQVSKHFCTPALAWWAQ